MPEVGRDPPRISIVVPSFNARSFIEAALWSALDQSRPPFEVIVQDGCSTDGTVDVLGEMGTSIKWRSERDTGQSQAINRAMSRATGEVIGWLNADDVYLPGALEAVAAAFASDPGVEAVFGDFDFIDAAGRTIRRYETSAYDRRRLLLRGCYLFSGATFVRRSLLDRVGGLDESLHTSMDYDWFLRFGDETSTLKLDRTLGCQRIHQATKSSRMLGRFVREVRLVRARHRGSSWSMWIGTEYANLWTVAYVYSTPFRYSRLWSSVRKRKKL